MGKACMLGRIQEGCSAGVLAGSGRLAGVGLGGWAGGSDRLREWLVLAGLAGGLRLGKQAQKRGALRLPLLDSG